MLRAAAATRALLPLVLTAATLGLAGCGSDDDTASAAPTVSATTAAPSAGTSASPTAAPPSPDDAQAVSITFTGGEVTGVEARTQVPVGTRVRLTITSDVADTVHVHGFDLEQALTPGQAVSLEFVADQQGIFEIELHDAGTVLTRLQVQ